VHKGFNLRLSDSADWLQWKQSGDALFDNQRTSVRDNIEAYVEAGVIDGGALQSTWFGQQLVDVFISHSHKDRDLAISIAGWLHGTFGLHAFVDSCVWGYANDLQKEIDNKHCRNSPPATTYDYDKRNRSTSHVHMMLSTALSGMIDKAECFFFLHTDESIVKNDVKTNIGRSVTDSPWIYAELATTRIIRKRPTGRDTTSVLKKATEAAMDSLTIHYPAHLAHLTAIDDAILTEWEASGQRKKAALDELYALVE
jgi:hypothetical protein